LKRALDWDMNQVEITPRERQQLVAADVAGPRLQGLLAWRRSCLMLAMPVLLLTVALSAWEAARTDTEAFTGFGKLWLWLPPLGLALVPLGALTAITRWTEIRQTSQRLVSCWIASIAIPLLAAIVPLEFIIDLDAIRASAGGDEDVLELLEGEIFSARLLLAVGYAMTLLPIIISVPAGVLKGAVRVKTVFPAAVLPGWFLVAVAPFYSLFTVVVFVLIEQIVGNLLLVLGIGLLAFAPWLYVIHRKIYARSMSNAEAAVELTKASKTGRWITLTGLACVVTFAFTAKAGQLDVVGTNDEEAVFTYLQIIRTAIEVFSRGLVTTVVFSLIFLSMVYAEWRNNQTMTLDIRREHEAEMGELLKFVEANPNAAAPITEV